MKLPLPIPTRAQIALACVALQAMAACKNDDSPSGVSTGSIRVTVTTTGTDIDPDGYAVAVDNGQARAIAANGTLTIDQVQTGERSVTLSGLASNCTATSATQTAAVAAGSEAAVNFQVTCGAAVSAIDVSVATSGEALDADGYTVSLDAGAGQAVGVNGTVSFASVSAGTHSVTLGGLAAGCAVNGTNPRVVTATANGAAQVNFAVVCSSTAGSLVVSVTTTGSDVDAGGYQVSVDGGAGEAVTPNGTVSFANLTAGQHSVQISDVAANCAVNGANPQTATVTAGASTTASFAVTCGGARIVFASNRDGNYEIYASAADGSNVTRLTSAAEPDDAPAWSPDYSKIAFASPRGGDGYDIYVMDADGSNVTRLTTASGDDNFPAWSRDGSKIAFTSARDGNDEIYVMNADGTGQANVTDNPAKDQVPAWSADGARIAFQSDRDAEADQFEIFTVRPDGGDVTKIVSSPAGDFHPTYSPDGLRLLFASSRDDPQREIYVVNVDGTGLQRLTTNPAIDNWPTWSPDGTRIAFYSDRDGNLELYTMAADGTGVTRITNNSAGDIRPSWRP